MVACDIADTFIAEMYDYYVYNTMVLDILIAIIYIFVWVAIKKNIQGFFYETFVPQICEFLSFKCARQVAEVFAGYCFCKCGRLLLQFGDDDSWCNALALVNF